MSASAATAMLPQDPALAAALAAPRLVIARVRPCVDGGRYPGKAIVGQPLAIEADVFGDGHEQLAAELRWGNDAPLPMEELGNDRWRTWVTPARIGMFEFRIDAWVDPYASHVHDVRKKREAQQPIKRELAEGVALLQRAQQRSGAAMLGALLDALAAADEVRQYELLTSAATLGTMRQLAERPFLQRSPAYAVDVERLRAGFGAWYELFPRSQSGDAGRHGTFHDVVHRLPAIKAMGFDVLYLPPIHPIGHTHRKGRNNSLVAQPGDPGSPYAIGNELGGHDAIHPELGGIEGFRRLRQACAEHGLEIALDFAIQCSPDHPWIRQHPEWFSWRSDGSLRHAENPPKKYEDIVNVDFYAPGAQPSLWLALRDVVLHWVGLGVKIFRVDNPHTKPLPFWQWLIADVRAAHPEVIFLAEAFTRPAMMYRLGEIGFSQSYTYFTWRHSRAEFIEYLTELTQGPARDSYRPNFFVNTPDINPYFLHNSGRAGFVIRAALAATLAGSWGLYSGFELCESAPLPGKEEYLDSEKYQLRPRDWSAPGNIIAEISALNRIRREHPALQSHLHMRFLPSSNEQVLFFEKTAPGTADRLLIAITLDPWTPQDAWLEIPDGGPYEVQELMRGYRFTWRGRTQHWRFIPQEMPVAIWQLEASHAA
ncbi:MAG TPA: alpha-1,4-glucan--maltose-1-phosphate maltosyltransferase [Nevskiaceae bacterium]|nr:alpha-1,4-glucan--maltose-1-phosphate maltosyltransferase [Nevskiaceae bacterium]